MIMRLCLMTGMLMVVIAVFTGVIMIMTVGSAFVGMFMGVLMGMFVGMGVDVLVTVGFPVMGMLVAVGVGVLMLVEMLVLMFSFHGRFSFAVPDPSGCFEPFAGP